jgi:hypothetical protein
MKAQSKTDDNDDHENNAVDDDRVEITFQLLRDAKKFESEQKHWLATEKFVEAYQLLRILAEEENNKVTDLSTTATAAAAQNDDSNETCGDDDDDNNNINSEEEIKNVKQIAQLYTSKANEYWKQSRQCLIQAMEQEKKIDDDNKKSNNTDTDNDTGDCSLPCSSCTLLDDDQARIRNYNFSLLFSRPIVDIGVQPPPVGEVVEENTTTIDEIEIPPPEENTNPNLNPTSSLIDQQWSLEERLQNLNKTLPSSFKSTDERMSEVNKGLNKLGLSLYTQKEPFARFATQQEIPKSEEEQIDEIMNQAKDEANVEEQINNNNNYNYNNVSNNNNQSNKEEEDEFYEDSDDEDEDDEGDLLLDDDQLFMKSIKKKVVKAQIKLTEFLAILNEAQSMKAKEEDIDDDNYDDKDSDDDSFNDDIAKPDLAFSLLTGKNKLKGAQRDMRKALAEFDNISM